MMLADRCREFSARGDRGESIGCAGKRDGPDVRPLKRSAGRWETAKWHAAALALTLAILAGTYGLFFKYFSHIGKQFPKAENGYLDLSGWRFAEDGPVRLDGEWEFFPNRLPGPDGLAEEGEWEPELIRVPGVWTEHMPTYGVATYRLRIRVEDTEPVYGLKTYSIQMANRLYVKTGKGSFTKRSATSRSGCSSASSCFRRSEAGWRSSPTCASRSGRFVPLPFR